MKLKIYLFYFNISTVEHDNYLKQKYLHSIELHNYLC